MAALMPLLMNREDGDDHRSPPVHHQERRLRRRPGPAAGGGVRPAHGAAGKQAGTVQEADGEAGVSPGRTAASASLRTGRAGGRMKYEANCSLRTDFLRLDHIWTEAGIHLFLNTDLI